MMNGKLLIKKLEQNKEHEKFVCTETQNFETYRGVITNTHNNEMWPIGNVVLFSKYSGEEIYINSGKYIILDHEDIYAMEENNEKV